MVAAPIPTFPHQRWGKESYTPSPGFAGGRLGWGQRCPTDFDYRPASSRNFAAASLTFAAAALSGAHPYQWE